MRSHACGEVGILSSKVILMLTVVGASMWDVARLLDAISGGLGRFSTREFGATADIEASEAQDVCHFLT